MAIPATAPEVDPVASPGPDAMPSAAANVPTPAPTPEESDVSAGTPYLTARLDADEKLRAEILKLIKNYLQFSRVTLDDYTGDFDVAHDVLNCYAILRKEDYVKLAKGHPRRFILPVTATHVHTMTTFLAQSLFGGVSPNTVDAGGPESEAPARVMNKLLEWNAQQQPGGMYQMGWFWIENALTYNRGIFYDQYASLWKSTWQEVDDHEQLDETGQPKKVMRKVKTRTGGYCKLDIVSPYDFFMDPLMPIFRMQEGRFAGHRINKTWDELDRRSRLDPDDPMYVSQRAVAELKVKPSKGLAFPVPTSAQGGTGSELLSRTQYERARLASPMGSKADTKDPGVIDFAELWVRLVPNDYGIDNRTEPTVFQITMGNEREICSMAESTYDHDYYPYSVGEPRPSPFYQFSPSWVLILLNLQNYIDYLKDRHQEAVTRTIGNVFIAKSHLIDIKDFEDPEKEGKFISILPDGANMPIGDIIKQVPIVDMTEGFMKEMQGFVSFAESTSGAQLALQGSQGGDTTATEFSGALHMAQGRLGAIARLLSVQGIVPLTKRFVSNFQQFYDATMVQKVEGEDDLDMTDGTPQLITISPDTVQGEFTYRPHDGTLPGADGKKVAALSAAAKSMGSFPQVWTPDQGNLDPRRVYLDLFRATGVDVEKYRWRPADIAKAQAAAASQAQAAATAKQHETRTVAPSLAIQAKWGELTPEERIQLMMEIGVHEDNLMPNIPIPPGMGQHHPAFAAHPHKKPPAVPSGLAPALLNAAAARGAPSATSGPAPAAPRVPGIQLPSAVPPQVRPANQ